ncbi:MAG: hypothetical protein V1494_07480 [Candidatus Diapherotrites archaeon]
MRITATRLLFLAIVLGILARAIAFFFLPETAFTDALHHLVGARNIISSGALLPSNDFTFYSVVSSPLYYLITAGAFLFSALPFEFPFLRLLPLIFSALLLLLSYLFLKRLFPEKWLWGFAFMASIPWLVIYGALNYQDVLAAVFVLLSLYFLLLFGKTSSRSYLLLLALSLFALAVSKANAVVFLPFLVIFAFLEMHSKKFSWKHTAIFSLVLLLAAFFWLPLSAHNYQDVSESFAGRETGLALESFSGRLSELNPLSFTALSHAYIYGFPPIDSFSSLGFSFADPWLLLALFSLVVLPLTAAILFGAKKIFVGKDAFLKNCVYIAVIGLLFVVFITLTDPRSLGAIYTRYFIPAMPLLAVPFVAGVSAIKSDAFKKIVLASLVLFALFSLAYVSFTSLYYNGIAEKHAPLYEFSKSLPKDSKVFALREGRAIAFYAGVNFDRNEEIIRESEADFYSYLKSNGFSHVVKSCYRDDLSIEELDEMEGKGLLLEIFSDQCSAVYEVK